MSRTVTRGGLGVAGSATATATGSDESPGLTSRRDCRSGPAPRSGTGASIEDLGLGLLGGVGDHAETGLGNDDQGEHDDEPDRVRRPGSAGTTDRPSTRRPRRAARPGTGPRPTRIQPTTDGSISEAARANRFWVRASTIRATTPITTGARKSAASRRRPVTRWPRPGHERAQQAGAEPGEPTVGSGGSTARPGGGGSRPPAARSGHGSEVDSTSGVGSSGVRVGSSAWRDLLDPAPWNGRPARRVASGPRPESGRLGREGLLRGVRSEAYTNLPRAPLPRRSPAGTGPRRPSAGRRPGRLRRTCAPSPTAPSRRWPTSARLVSRDAGDDADPERGRSVRRSRPRSAAARGPRPVASAPPSSDPSGRGPQSMNRKVALTRPMIASLDPRLAKAQRVDVEERGRGGPDEPAGQQQERAARRRRRAR